VAAFALFKFVQSIGSATAFLYSATLNLHYQLYLLAVIASMATICFCFVESNSRLGALGLEKSDSQQDIVGSNPKRTEHYGTSEERKGDTEICIN